MRAAASRVIRVADVKPLLSSPSWTVHDLITHAAPLRDPPSEAELVRLSQLAGLKPPTREGIESFFNQLRFVEVLRGVDTSGVPPVSRLIETVEVPSLDDATRSDVTEPEIGNWDPTSVASEKEAGLYVVKDTLHRDQ